MIEKPSESMFTDCWEEDWYIVYGDDLLARELTRVFEEYLVALHQEDVPDRR